MEDKFKDEIVAEWNDAKKNKGRRSDSVKAAIEESKKNLDKLKNLQESIKKNRDSE